MAWLSARKQKQVILLSSLVGLKSYWSSIGVTALSSFLLFSILVPPIVFLSIGAGSANLVLGLLCLSVYAVIELVFLLVLFFYRRRKCTRSLRIP